MGKVFSREKFIQSAGEKGYRICRMWVDECDGKPVKNGRCGPYGISDSWCIDVPDEKEETKKVYTMKDFREKKIAVRVGQKHVKEFLQMCEEAGLKWEGGFKATAIVPDHYNDVTIASYGYPCIQYATSDFFRYEKGYTIVDFEDIERPASRHRYRIIIDCDGDTTTARMEVGGREVKTRQARRNPKDKFSWRVGAETAFGRLWDEKIKKKPQKGVREVRRPANVVEWVKIVVGCAINGHKPGDILRVVDSYQPPFGGQCGVFLEGEDVQTYTDEYVVLEGYKPGKGRSI